jgi:hypothetical protein
MIKRPHQAGMQKGRVHTFVASPYVEPPMGARAQGLCFTMSTRSLGDRHLDTELTDKRQEPWLTLAAANHRAAASLRRCFAALGQPGADVLWVQPTGSQWLLQMRCPSCFHPFPPMRPNCGRDGRLWQRSPPREPSGHCICRCFSVDSLPS